MARLYERVPTSLAPSAAKNSVPRLASGSQHGPNSLEQSRELLGPAGLSHETDAPATSGQRAEPGSHLDAVLVEEPATQHALGTGSRRQKACGEVRQAEALLGKSPESGVLQSFV